MEINLTYICKDKHSMSLGLALISYLCISTLGDKLFITLTIFIAHLNLNDQLTQKCLQYIHFKHNFVIHIVLENKILNFGRQKYGLCDLNL